MNITLNPFSQYLGFPIQKSLTSSLTATQLKIVTVAAIALTCLGLALYYVITHYCCKVKPLKVKRKLPETQDSKLQVPKPQAPKPPDTQPLTDDEYGVYNGKGKRIINNIIYEGEFTNGELNGQGKQTFRAGSVHEGFFESNRLHGEGTIKFSQGDLQEEKGTFEFDILNGKGTRIYQDRTEEGEFEDGFLRQGKILYKDGREESGLFDLKGKLIPTEKVLLPRTVTEILDFANGRFAEYGDLKDKILKEIQSALPHRTDQRVTSVNLDCRSMDVAPSERDQIRKIVEGFFLSLGIVVVCDN